MILHQLSQSQCLPIYFSFKSIVFQYSREGDLIGHAFDGHISTDLEIVPLGSGAGDLKGSIRKLIYIEEIGIRVGSCR